MVDLRETYKKAMMVCASRYGKPRYLEIVDDNTYHIWGGSVNDTMWIGLDRSGDVEKYTSIDYEGGPKFSINTNEGLVWFNIKDRLVTSIEGVIDNTKPNKYKLTVKEFKEDVCEDWDEHNNMM